WHAVQVPWIPRREVAGVFGRAAHRELVAVGHTQHHGAGLEKPRHRGRGVRRFETTQDLRARRGLDATHAEHVLDRHRYAGQRRRLALPDLPIGLVGLLLPELWCEAQVRLHVRVEALDPLDVRGHELGRGDRPDTPQPGGVFDRQFGEIVGHASSWIAGTRKKPSTFAGALTSASSWVSPGRGPALRGGLAISPTG